MYRVHYPVAPLTVHALGQRKRVRYRPDVESSWSLPLSWTGAACSLKSMSNSCVSACVSFQNLENPCLPSYSSLSLMTFKIFSAGPNLNDVFCNAALAVSNHKNTSVRRLEHEIYIKSSILENLSALAPSFHFDARSWRNMIRWL